MSGSGEGRAGGLRARRYLIAGIVTVIPIWITWWVFDFFFRRLSALGEPLVKAIANLVEPHVPGLAQFIEQPAFQTALAVVLTLSALYFIGFFASRVIGRRLITLFDAIMERIPLVERVYGSTRRVLLAVQEKPRSVQRVVLINFPSREMKAVGFVTKTFQDADTGEELAAVYVPTTPNPTSGYMEIVPLSAVIPTDWTVDEAIAFVISAGTITPDRISLRPDGAAGNDRQVG
jgi:uncharacterized membrane protein